MKLTLFLPVLFVFLPVKLHAFNLKDTLNGQEKRIDFMDVPDNPDPQTQMRFSRNMALRSAILPGLGQVSNKKYWKVPVIYAGFAGLGYSIYFNNQHLDTVRSAIRFHQGDTTVFIVDHYRNATVPGLLRVRNEYQRFRDLSIVLAGTWYLLNIMDAYVDAQFRFFKMPEEFSLHVYPAKFNNIAGEYTPMIEIKLKLNQ